MTNTFPTLYHLGKKNALYSWDVRIEGDTIISTTGQVDGQKIVSSKIATPKNIGKANATTAEEQAFKEASAMWKHKLDRKYSLTPEKAKEEEIAPMLAQSFEKRKDKNVTYPATVQPKLDGFRALAQKVNGKVILTSRGAKEWELVGHINEELNQAMEEGDVLDGEIYIHGVDFQTLSKWVKKVRPETYTLEYHVYDMPSRAGEDSLAWEDRSSNLEDFFNYNEFKNIKQVNSMDVLNEDMVYRVVEDFVKDGYEGGIVRLLDEPYTYGYRSYGLLKVKFFDDDEFKVIGVETGVGKFANSAIWVCETKDGQPFRATPKCTQAQKEQFLKDSAKYIGQMVTVAYFGKSNEGIPRFPVAKGFRPELDLS